MQQLHQQGYDRDLVLESLLAGDCNAATAAYHLMQQAIAMDQKTGHCPMQHTQQAGAYEVDAGLHSKHADTPVRILARSRQEQPAGIPAYRPCHVGLEVEGVSAGYDKGHKQHAGRVSDDSAQALHQPAVLHTRNGS